MFQLPVNNLARIRRARKQVKKSLEDIGLEFCKDVAEEFKEFCPDEEFVKDTQSVDICMWSPSFSKTQEYRSKPFCCAECSFSSKYYSGYRNHFRNVHRKLLDSQILLNCPYCSFIASKRTLETHVKIFHIPNSKQQNNVNSRATVLGAKTNLTNAAAQKGEKAMFFCKKCTFRDTLYNVVKRHIYREHFRHVVSPYFGMVSKSSVRNGSSVNGNNIFCKQCQFSTRSYEILVQHVLEYHERIGAQVTSMIAHANILVPVPQPFPAMNQRTQFVSRGKTVRSDPVAQPVIGYLKPPVKNQSIIQTSQVSTKPPVCSDVAANNATGLNTSQTQKWKICTVCNELFPENLYSAHFESAHKSTKLWALARYIMKIHNFTSKCLVCNRCLPSNTLLNHMLIHGLTCPQCHSIFHSVEKLMGHAALCHPSEFVGAADSSPLTFDINIKQGISRNIQLAVLTFNMKDSVNGLDQSAPALKSVPTVKAPPIVKMSSEPHGFSSVFHSSDVRKTVCPLCFTVIQAPITDALALHLRERHQVLQTMHPVEKRMTYKCIHCLGVYTSNMVASTITLHLVQCRAVGRAHVGQGFKSAMTLNSPKTGVPKRRMPIQGGPTSKKIKIYKGCEISDENNSLALDAKGYANKTYLAKKDFLTTYFNLRPYPTPEEEQKLSENLNMWRSEVASHFASKRNICFRSCKMMKVSVRLGFDMKAVNEVKHLLIFENGKLVGTSTVRSAGSKSVPNHTSKLNTCTETISIDSDSEDETKKPAAENKDQETATKLVDNNDPSAKTNSLQDENDCVIFEPETLPAENVESKNQKDVTKQDADEPSTENSSLQEGEDYVCMTIETETTTESEESKDQENMTEETKYEDTDDPLTENSSLQDEKENGDTTCDTETLPEHVESKDDENLTEETKQDMEDPSTEESVQDRNETVCMALETETTPSETVESNHQENLIQETKLEDAEDPSTENSSLQDEQEIVCMTFGTETPPENSESCHEENLIQETKLEDREDPLTENSSLLDEKEIVCMTFGTETPPENLESYHQENLIEEKDFEDIEDCLAENSSLQDEKEIVSDIEDCLAENSSLQDEKEIVSMTFETETPPEDEEFRDQENLTEETQHVDTEDSSE
ncbi:activity-dependent neuroprotector homeobox a [Nematolebias whitei]|uniref:activity-dependent neuroprotector homeobox a n=1 Tax=Nematolebias whitei TaxID=451745 RepID=UPI00189872DE|nr:activity-dependent neuroprotector homeobox a [Nematolebias whitei]